MAAWEKAGGDTSPLGARKGDVYPLGDGFALDFDGGKMFYTTATGAKFVYGPILDKYEQLGGPVGSDLGFPTINEVPGLAGPDITAVPLPVESPLPSRAAMETAREQLAVVGMPMVLVVGSHEPRKNHRAVLHAAELLWRDGLTFSLLFVGGNSWNSERFTRALRIEGGAGCPRERRR